ncbi:MAG: phosphoribosyltransferase family protein [Thermomicrobiales bacterium]
MTGKEFGQMGMLQGNILNDLKRQKLVREGHFSFSSGRHIAALLDLDHLTTDPVAVGHMSYAIAKKYFTNRIQTVASPSIQGAGLALWVAHYLDPKARVVGAESGKEGPVVPAALRDLIAGQRVLIVDDVMINGDLVAGLSRSIESAGGEVVGLACLWNVGSERLGKYDVFGLLNTAYEAWPMDDCPLCAAGTPVESAGY